MPTLSIVIRCRNEAASLRRLLSVLRLQICDFDWELIVVDNDSEDDSRAIAEEFRSVILSISKADFTYGAALNFGIGYAQSELILLLSAHALPVGRHFLADAVRGFDDPKMAAARCLAADNRRQMLRWENPVFLHYDSPQEQHAAEARDPNLSEYPAATCCVIRRSVWEEIKYDESMEFGEDKYWASRVLASGYSIRSCSEALWLYTREYTRNQFFKRLIKNYASFYRMTRRAPLSPLGYVSRLVKAAIMTPRVAGRYLLDKFLVNSILFLTPYFGRQKPKVGSTEESHIKQ